MSVEYPKSTNYTTQQRNTANPSEEEIQRKKPKIKVIKDKPKEMQGTFNQYWEDDIMTEIPISKETKPTVQKEDNTRSELQNERNKTNNHTAEKCKNNVFSDKE